MPITITIEAADANEIRQLVQDLAGTIAGMKPEELPVDTKVSTLNTAPTAPAAPPVSVTSATPTTQPAALQQAQAPTVTTAPVAPATPTVAPTAPAAPTSVPQYDFNQIATATMQLQQAGQNIFELFSQFGIQALNQLPKERYAEYAAALRQRGAKI